MVITVNKTIMTYDEWKQQTPNDQEEDAMYHCPECLGPVSKTGQYCSKDCEKASQL